MAYSQHTQGRRIALIDVFSESGWRSRSITLRFLPRLPASGTSFCHSGNDLKRRATGLASLLHGRMQKFEVDRALCTQYSAQGCTPPNSRVGRLHFRRAGDGFLIRSMAPRKKNATGWKCLGRGESRLTVSWEI